MANDNIYPDQSGGLYDIKYAQLRILASDVRRNFNQSQGQGNFPGPTEGGDDDPIPPGGSGCKKVYAANLNQTGTANPVASIGENTIGDIIWTRQDVGIYYGELAGAFPMSADEITWVMMNSPNVEAKNHEVRAQWLSEDLILIGTWDLDDSYALIDDVLINASIEIRTYCVSTPGACNDVQPGSDGFTLPQAYVGMDYLAELPLLGTAPFTLNITDKPDWMDITLVGGNVLTFSGTPTEEAADAPVELTVTNCTAGELVISELVSVITPVADFDYTVPSASSFYCQTLPSNPVPYPNPVEPNFTGGGIPGIFTAEAGLIFFDTGDNGPSPTGQVDIENTPPGTYTVTNTCGAVTHDSDITILALPVRTFTWSTDNVMSSGEGLVNPVIGGGGGILPNYDPFGDAAALGLVIDESTGQIDCGASTPGTYDVYIFYSSAACPNSTTVTVTINP